MKDAEPALAPSRARHLSDRSCPIPRDGARAATSHSPRNPAGRNPLDRRRVDLRKSARAIRSARAGPWRCRSAPIRVPSRVVPLPATRWRTSMDGQLPSRRLRESPARTPYTVALHDEIEVRRARRGAREKQIADKPADAKTACRLRLAELAGASKQPEPGLPRLRRRGVEPPRRESAEGGRRLEVRRLDPPRDPPALAYEHQPRAAHQKSPRRDLARARRHQRQCRRWRPASPRRAPAQAPRATRARSSAAGRAPIPHEHDLRRPAGPLRAPVGTLVAADRSPRAVHDIGRAPSRPAGRRCPALPSLSWPFGARGWKRMYMSRTARDDRCV